MTPFLLAGVDPNAQALDTAQTAIVTALATLAGGSVAGMLGQNAQAGAMWADNEASNNDMASLLHIQAAVGSAKNVGAGLWNGVVNVGEMLANIPNGGPFASKGDPGYISLDNVRLPYKPGDQIGPGVEFFTAALITKGSGRGAAGEVAAESEALPAEAQTAKTITSSNSSQPLSSANSTTSNTNVATDITGSAQTLYDQLPARLQTKTVATDGTTNTISGYGASLPDGYTYVDPIDVMQRADNIGHDLTAAGAMDQGTPGQYNASHAEKQSIVSNPSAAQIDVSRPMCADCQAFFKAEAAVQNRPIVVSDPSAIRTFLPNGKVIVTLRK